MSDQSKPGEFDPDDVLKGWSAPPPQRPPLDLDDMLGAVAGRARAHELQPVDEPRIDLPQVEIVDAVELSDIDDIGRNAAATARADALETLERVDDVEFTEVTTSVHRHANPRVLDTWRPGAWVGAVRQVCEAVTEFVQTEAGPVIETYPPHVLLALWPPQGPDSPLLGRWPLRAGITAAQSLHVTDDLLALMPPDALLWFSDTEVDWALVGKLVLHHDVGLKPYLMDRLREFVEAEQAATFARLNDGYGQPLPGAPIAQRMED